MIQEIFIRDLGIIREARLSLKPGLNVITGETGAGKTMVLSALGLLLGQRADANLIRNGATQLLVEGRLAISNPTIASRISDLGGNLDDGELIMNRSVSSEGKSRAALGGASVPIAALAEVGEQLVVVHGQSDQLRLKSPGAQRDALDEFAGHWSLLDEYRSAYTEYLQAQKQLVELMTNSSSRNLEIENLKLAIEEIEKVKPAPGEDVELANLANRLSNLEGLRLAASGAHESLQSEGDDSDAIGLIGVARKLLEHESDSKLQDLAKRLGEINFLIRDISGELASYLSNLDGDSELSLDQVQQRRAELNSLTRKYGATIEEVLDYCEQGKSRLELLDSSDDRIAELQAQVQTRLSQAKDLAENLSQSRAKAAAALAEAVTHELAGLAMKESRLVVQIEKADQLGPTGIDQVALLLTSYNGANPRPIAKAASGGEMSRIMLALEVVLAQKTQNSTFIFDEVDAGVGGAAAIEVGRRLARLAKQAQVIVVTHLAQVAAFADHQLRVLKSSTENFSETDVVILDDEARLEELTRMLSGLSDSESGRQHAAELMSLAKSSATN